MTRYITAMVSGMAMGVLGYTFKMINTNSKNKNNEKLARDIVSALASKCKNREELDEAIEEAKEISDTLDAFFNNIKRSEVKGKGRSRSVKEAEAIANVAINKMRKKRKEKKGA